MITISIILPIRNEEKYIEKCIESIIDSDIENFELILVDGGSSDNTLEIIKKYKNKYLFIKLLDNPKKFTPISMNIGIKASVGDYIFIISAHAEYQDNYFSLLVEKIQQLGANCVGGVLETEVKNKNRKSNSIKKILTHRFGVGNAEFRIGSEEIKEVDTVAFGCYTRDTFEKFGLYNEKLIRNQDIELNKRIINGGGSIYLIPFVKAIYYARDNFNDLAKNNYENGKWNILTAYYTKSFNSLSTRHFIPLLFILSVILPIVLIPLSKYFIYITFSSFISYISLILIVSIQDKENSFIYSIFSFFVLHISYGFGSLRGLLDVIREKYE